MDRVLAVGEVPKCSWCRIARQGSTPGPEESYRPGLDTAGSMCTASEQVAVSSDTRDKALVLAPGPRQMVRHLLDEVWDVHKEQFLPRA